jgi:hypothetical protein
MVIYYYNPSCSGNRGRKITVQGLLGKIAEPRAGGMTQAVKAQSPKFKPQYHQNSSNNKTAKGLGA